MDTHAFFSKILPSTGIVVLAEPKISVVNGKRSSAWRHFKYSNIDEAASAASLLDSKGITVYHACSTFRENREKRMRTQENAGWQKAFWVDADVGQEDGKYATQREAVIAIHTLCKNTGLPLPTIINSGGGIHAYWTLTVQVESATWTPIARQFKAFLAGHAFKQDTSRTADCASVLRPVGTHNRKKDTPRQVRLVHEGVDVELQKFVDIIGAELPVIGVDTGVDNDDLSGGIEYPASSAERIIRFCATLNHVADVRGDVREPLWHKTLGVVKFTIEGAAKCHEWSMGYPGYDQYETQQKIDNWAAGPTTCAVFRQSDGNKCTGCTRTCKTPLQLGYLDNEDVHTVDTPQPASGDTTVFGTGDSEDTEASRSAVRLPRGFRFLNQQLCKMVKEGAEEDAPVRPVPFCDTLFYPLERVRSEDMTWAMRMETILPTGVYRQFLVPTQYMVEPQALASEMAKHEVFIYGRKGKDYAMDYYREYIKDIMATGPELHTHAAFGWTDSGDGFILGGKEVNQDGEKEILVTEGVAKILSTSSWTSGSRDEWVSLVDQIYNRPGAEPYQFCFLAALASPLISIAGIDQFHGIPIALTGETSLGKTTTAKMACSVFGPSKDMYQDASIRGGTMAYILARIGMQRHLPLIMDEMTQRKPDEYMDMLFSLSNGQGKGRITSTGQLNGPKVRFDLFSFITGNIDITETLGTLEGMRAEATQVRCFEIKLPKDFNTRVFGNTPVSELIDTKLQNTYGHVGAEYLRYVMKHKAKVRDMIFKIRAKYNPKNSDESRERFYKDTIVLATVAGLIANKLGILRFDTERTIRWALGHVKTLRIIRKQNQLSDAEYLAAFLSSLRGRILVTPTIPAIHNGRHAAEAPLDQLNGPIVARQALKSRRFIVTVKATHDWEAEHGLGTGRLHNYLLSSGLMVLNETMDKRGCKLVTLGRGTTIPTGQSRCIELVYDKVVDVLDAVDAEAPANVIPLTGT